MVVASWTFIESQSSSPPTAGFARGGAHLSAPGVFSGAGGVGGPGEKQGRQPRPRVERSRLRPAAKETIIIKEGQGGQGGQVGQGAGRASRATRAGGASRASRSSRQLAELPTAHYPLLVSQRLDGVQPRGADCGEHPEEDADRGGEPEAEGERPPRQRDGEAREVVNADADRRAEHDAQDAAGRGEHDGLEEELPQDLPAAGAQ